MPGPVERDVNGIINALYEGDYGEVSEGDTLDNENPRRDFYQNGANVEFVEGDLVTYIEVTFPDTPGTGDKPPLVKNIKKKPS
ncbi:hypothetical protein JYT74_03700 [Crocinitomix catalasitica]|nr:hypothetical protein [Crocinitomix catalasitica]